jgi:hypothetical protein
MLEKSNYHGNYFQSQSESSHTPDFVRLPFQRSAHPSGVLSFLSLMFSSSISQFFASRIVQIPVNRHLVIVIFFTLIVTGRGGEHNTANSLSCPDEELIPSQVPTGRQDLASNFTVSLGAENASPEPGGALFLFFFFVVVLGDRVWSFEARFSVVLASGLL